MSSNYAVGTTRIFTLTEFVELAPHGLILREYSDCGYYSYHDETYWYDDQRLMGCWRAFKATLDEYDTYSPTINGLADNYRKYYGGYELTIAQSPILSAIRRH